MWAIIISALGHFLKNDARDRVWMQVDDGDRVEALTGIIGYAFFAALHALDRIEELKKDPAYLVLIMALQSQFSRNGMTTYYHSDGEDIE